MIIVKHTWIPHRNDGRGRPLKVPCTGAWDIVMDQEGIYALPFAECNACGATRPLRITGEPRETVDRWAGGDEVVCATEQGPKAQPLEIREPVRRPTSSTDDARPQLRAQRRARYPHAVKLEPPEGGWGKRLYEMYDWCRDRFGTEAYRQRFGAWRFKTDADAFQGAFVGERVWTG